MTKLCPSAQPRMRGAVAFGLTNGNDAAPEVTWLERPVPVTNELLEKAGDAEAERIFRVAAPCQEGACLHWSGSKCKLAQRIVHELEPAAELPPCQLRRGCRWFGQEGREACARCAQVITHSYDPPLALVRAAMPQT